MQNPFQALFSKFVHSIHLFSSVCQQNVTFYMKTLKTPPQKSLFSEIVPQPLLANKEKYLPLLGPSASGSCSDDQSRATTPAKPFATFSDVIGEVIHPKVRKSS